MKHLLLALVGTVAVAFTGFASVETGKPAPDFTVKDCCGTEVALTKYKGKIVVLEWNNLGCPFVKKHYESKNMQALQEKYTGKGVVWLTINSGAPGKQGSIADSHEAAMKARSSSGMKNTALLVDADGRVGKAYGAKVTPHMFVIDAAGNIAYQGAIDDNPSPEHKADAKNHVAETVDALLAGKPVPVAETKPYGCGVKY
jgi:peroxiredoxin